MNIRESFELATAYLDIERMPVGVKFIYSEEEFDSFDADFRETKIAYCNSIHLASIGEKLKLIEEHQACFNGSVALGFKEYPEKMTSGKARLSKGIYHDLETSKSVSEDMIFNDKKPYGYVVMPLKEFEIDPDVVLVIGKSYSIMRLIQGYSFKYGYSPNIKTVGLQAVCHDITTYPMMTNDVNITFLCPGTRLVANWEMDELGFGIPFSKWYDVIEGVVKTTNPFVRNPIKKEIKKKLDGKNMDSSNIKLNENYDTGAYVGGKVEK